VRRSCIPKFLSFRAKKILCEAKDLRSRGTCFLSAARRTRGDGRAQSKMAPAVIAASTASGEVFLGGPVLATGAENGYPALNGICTNVGGHGFSRAKLIRARFNARTKSAHTIMARHTA